MCPCNVSPIFRLYPPPCILLCHLLIIIVGVLFSVFLGGFVVVVVVVVVVCVCVCVCVLVQQVFCCKPHTCT